jgi:hypothetical protein
MTTSRIQTWYQNTKKHLFLLPNSVIRVRREKVMVHSGSQTRPGTGSLQPVAIRAAVEATRPLKPLVQKVVKATR